MPYWPQSAVGLQYITYPVGPVASGVVMTSGAANAKGSYTEIVASTSFTSNYLGIFVGGGTGTGGAGRQWLIDVAVGAAASEVVKVPNLAMSVGINQSGRASWTLHLAIPSGSRVAGRYQDTPGATQLRISIMLANAGGIPGVASYVSYGADTSDSGGTALDPGGTIDTKGAYVQLSASTSAVIQELVMSVGFVNNGNPSMFTWIVDLATGAAASEVVLIPDIYFMAHYATNTASEFTPQNWTYATYIAQSTRLAARASSSGNDASDRLLDVSLVAATAPTESPIGVGYLVDGGLAA